MVLIHQERVRFSPIPAALVLSILLVLLAGCRPRPPEHGVLLVVSADLSGAGRAGDRRQSIEETRAAMVRRLEKLSVARAIAVLTNNDQIHLVLPGLSEADYRSLKRRIVGGVFEFRRVHPESDALVDGDRAEPGYEILTEDQVSREGVPVKRRLLVSRTPERGLTGQRIRSAAVTRSPMSGQHEIVFQFDAEGGRLFADVTRELSPREGRRNRLALVLDGEVLSAPVIAAPVEGGMAQISGRLDEREAREIAAVLDTPLPVPVKVVEERVY